MAGQALGALGLRGRIVGAVLVTAVAALAVAAVVLLGPLGNSLRTAEKNTLQQQVPSSTTGALAHRDPSWAAYFGSSHQAAGPIGAAQYSALKDELSKLAGDRKSVV